MREEKHLLGWVMLDGDLFGEDKTLNMIILCYNCVSSSLFRLFTSILRLFFLMSLPKIFLILLSSVSWKWWCSRKSFSFHITKYGIDYFYEDFRILWVLIALWFVLNKCYDNCYYYGDDDDDDDIDFHHNFYASPTEIASIVIGFSDFQKNTISYKWFFFYNI